MEAKDPAYVRGLTTSNIGSIYEVTDTSTKAGSSETDSTSQLTPVVVK